MTLDAVPGTDRVFTLRFGAATAVPEGLYRIHHRDLAPVELFIAPHGPHPRQLEAVVNHGAA